MELYVGMDVSLKETSICVVDGNGEIVTEGTVLSEPEAIAEFAKTKAPHAKRIGLETGPKSRPIMIGMSISAFDPKRTSLPSKNL